MNCNAKEFLHNNAQQAAVPVGPLSFMFGFMHIIAAHKDDNYCMTLSLDTGLPEAYRL